ncbi:MAG: hypothetical protein H6953_06940 [Chromatiaceae bacterium]|nr:hypothetical protein [Gammaproteobacteria bacterium]MCP5305166.1 hypothetical protein [Chromatiaceae bacterium]MCP5315125.1 hypothetical protein [Chromatiaceae bacterium]
MNDRLMILPAQDKTKIRLVRIPPDFQDQEVFRHVTGLIAQVEEENADHTWEDVLAMLEDRGFEPVEFQLGPSLD